MVLGVFFFRNRLDGTDASTHHMSMTTTQYSNLKFVTPPRNQGQIVQTAYAIDADNEEIVSRWHDSSDGSTSYAVTPLGNLRGEFEPWNRAPAFHDYGLWEAVSEPEKKERTSDMWWAWHDQDSSRWSQSADEAEERCAAWVSGDSDDGPVI